MNLASCQSEVWDPGPRYGLQCANKCRISFFGLFLLWFGSVPAPTYAAESTMLIEAVAGQTYERTSFDAGGQLISRSILKTGAVQKAEDGSLIVVTDMTTFSASGEAQSSKQLRWSCDPEAAAMLMSIFLLAGDELKSSTQVAVNGPHIYYPATVSPGTDFGNVQFDLKLRGGFLSFLGTHTRVMVSNRQAAVSGASEPGDYLIESNVETTIYVLGIPAKRTRFKSLEIVQAGRVLLQQRITFSDGRYSVIEQVTAAAASETESPVL